MRSGTWPALVLAFTLGCAGTEGGPAAPLEVRRVAADGGTRLVLVAAPGIRINAQLKPALELADGTVLRFDSPRLTPDSAYFADPPSALVDLPVSRVRGTLRASICGDDAACRPFVLKL